MKFLPKKIEVISCIVRPTDTTHIRSFIGLINYYKDIWPRRAHILVSLTELCSSKKKIIWTDTHEICSNQAERLVAEDIFSQFPDHSLPFGIFH